MYIQYLLTKAKLKTFQMFTYLIIIIKGFVLGEFMKFLIVLRLAFCDILT